MERANTMPGVQKSSVGARRKKSLTKWSKFSTVSWRMDAQKDYTEHVSTVVATSWLEQAWREFQRWLLPALIGILTATAGAFIEHSVDLYGSLRFGYCPANYILNKEKCGDHWVSYSELGFPYLAYVGVSCGLVLVAALLVRFVAPTARGSGIPEVKTILGGFGIDDVLSFKTLITKIVGLGFSVGAGLSCGKEGPLVHIACCWSNCLAYFVTRWRKNDAKQRDLLSTAAAAGVSVAFGAPLGGVLFSFEEVSTRFPSHTMVLAFFAATVAAVTLDWWNPTGTGKLTLFQTHYDVPPAFPEYIGFAILGVLGGLTGALFVHYNIMICAGRGNGTRWRSRVPEVFEVLLICLCTAVTSYPNRYTRVLSSRTIRSLFHACDDDRASRPDMMGLCDFSTSTPTPRTDAALAGELLVAGLLRFVQMTFTFGAGVPAGLFVPCLFTGACLGRVVGFGAHYINSLLPADARVVVNPGVYAMVGAASVLGGVCRVTISLVVIMFELTDGLQLVVPFMCACLISKFVGDYFTGGIYDCAIRLRGYPFLHEPDEAAFHIRAEDVMDVELDVLDCEETTIDELIAKVRSHPHSGFPLIKSRRLGIKTLVGYVHSAQLVQHLQEELRTNQLLSGSSRVSFRPQLGSHATDLSPKVDVTVYRTVKEMPAKEIHEMFRKLGIKLILVEEEGQLVGMITKKSFIDHVDEIERAAASAVRPPMGGRGDALAEPMLGPIDSSPVDRAVSDPMRAWNGR